MKHDPTQMSVSHPSGSAPFTDFVVAVTKYLNNAHDDDDGDVGRAEVVALLLKELIGFGDGWLPDVYHVASASTCQQYLYPEEREVFGGVICVGPSQCTPIHDHGNTWGSCFLFFFFFPYNADIHKSNINMCLTSHSKAW